MIENTLLIFGPGGIGKSPIDALIRGDAYRIDPYRLRVSGPRDRADVFYAHPKLHAELSETFQKLGDESALLSTNPVTEWYPASQVAFFQVRDEWQGMFLGGISAVYAKAEIFAPVVPVLFGKAEIGQIFGKVSIVILNPANDLRSLHGDFSSIQSKTKENCQKRGDSDASIGKRTASVAEEAAAWLELLKWGATEFSNWEYPESVYQADRVKTLRAVRSKLIAGNPVLAAFFKPEAEIL